MEEEIKMLEKDITYNKRQMKEISSYIPFDINLMKRVENLIKGYRELEEKTKKNIEPVLINNKMYFIDKELYEDLLKDTKTNYIPKSKVKEKIEELLKKLDEPNNDRWEKDDDIYYNKIKAQIRVLQELMGE